MAPSKNPALPVRVRPVGIVLTVAAALAAAISATGCVSTEVVTFNPDMWIEPFVPGNVLRLTRDYYLCRDDRIVRAVDLSAGDEIDQHTVGGSPNWPWTPRQYKEGKTGDGWIVGVVSAGTELQVHKLLRHNNVTHVAIGVVFRIITGPHSGKQVEWPGGVQGGEYPIYLWDYRDPATGEPVHRWPGRIAAELARGWAWHSAKE
jgi:hypothetical protein